MKIIVAPNALKHSLSARRAAEAIAAGVKQAIPDARIEKFPVADGGDGLLEVLADALDADWHRRTVRGPLGHPVEAAFLFCATEKLAVIEMASAAGLALIPDAQRDPVLAGSYGVGELIGAALDLGAKRILLGIGGSATTDGATGLASALGVRFLDEHGKDLPGNGAALERIRHLELGGLDTRLRDVQIDVACDVDNPLLGDAGAARVYGPQKGASAAQVAQLERGLENLAQVIETELGFDARALPGGGAAGGLGAGLAAFFNARLTPGAQRVLELLGVAQALADADLVITCEGQLDEQTRFGKAPAVVAQAAQASGVPCIAIAGRVGPGAYQLHDIGIKAVFSLCPGPVSLEDALEHAPEYLAASAEQIARCYQAAVLRSHTDPVAR